MRALQRDVVGGSGFRKELDARERTQPSRRGIERAAELRGRSRRRGREFHPELRRKLDGRLRGVVARQHVGRRFAATHS